MLDWIIQAYATDALVKFFFWGPVVFNASVYPFFVWKKVQDNRKRVANNGPTYDFITVGDLVKYFFCTITPIMNAMAMIFQTGPEAFEMIGKHFSWLFSITLVKIPAKK